jgi:hypothetical protein
LKLAIAKQKTVSDKIMEIADRKGIFGAAGLITYNKLREVLLH